MNAIINTKTVFSVSGHFDRTKSMSHMLFYINIRINVIVACLDLKLTVPGKRITNYKTHTY